MKRTLKMAAFALIIVLSSSVGFRASAQSDDYYDDSRDVDYQTFYDELSPHGNWIEYPEYGYVWQPSMGQNFRPYSTGGHWVWSDNYEWVWVSDYDWGWAPFHYGRWFQDPYYGWLWVPGYEWSGAWVTWRDGGDYYGWAPIRPGISISINFNIGGYSPPVDWWCFAPRRYILYPNIYNHCIDYRRNVTIINYTTIINNYHYGDRYGWRSGPRRYDAERYTGRINPVRFRNTSSPGRSTFRNNEVSIYRPNVRQRDFNTNSAPRKFDRYDRNGGNSTVRNNDRTNNGGFRRNENGNPGNRDINTRTNDQPNRERVFRQQQSNGNDGNNPRRFERNNSNGNNVDQPNRDTRRIRPERTERVDQPVNDNPRRFERTQNNNLPERRQAPQRIEERRQMPQQMERKQNTQQMERRQMPQQQMERRQQAPQQMERRQMPQQQIERRQQAPQQMERRQAPQQMERRQAPQRVEQPQQQQSQQRNSERRSDDGNNGKGNGKRRF